MSNFSQLVLEKMMLTVFSIKAHWKLQTDTITVLHLYLAVVLFWHYWQTLPKAPNIDTANISQVRRYRNLISTSIYRWSHSTIMFYYKLINTFTLLKSAIKITLIKNDMYQHSNCHSTIIGFILQISLQSEQRQINYENQLIKS